MLELQLVEKVLDTKKVNSTLLNNIFIRDLGNKFTEVSKQVFIPPNQLFVWPSIGAPVPMEEIEKTNMATKVFEKVLNATVVGNSTKIDEVLKRSSKEVIIEPPLPVIWPSKPIEIKSKIGIGEEVLQIFSQTFRDLLSTGGPAALFTGALPRVFFFGPAAMIFFSVYETAFDIISSK